jgi:hypothetical protein
MAIKINYPPPAFKIRDKEGLETIFDEARRKWVVLTPEEWVRQNFIQYLVQVKGYPLSLIAVEREIKLGELRKRFDIIVFNRDGGVHLLVECKAMDIVLDDKIIRQTLAYYSVLQSAWLIMTNGTYCAGFKKEGNRLEEVTDIPFFAAM